MKSKEEQNTLKAECEALTEDELSEATGGVSLTNVTLNDGSSTEWEDRVGQHPGKRMGGR